jgi:hypothetical protein
MGVGTHTRARQALIGLAIGALLLAAGGCRSMLPAPPAAKVGYRYFARPAPDDAWSRKIRGWQQRERGPDETPAVATEPPRVGEESGALRSKYAAFRSERRREMAR